jgi:hypothetical protein
MALIQVEPCMQIHSLPDKLDRTTGSRKSFFVSENKPHEKRLRGNTPPVGTLTGRLRHQTQVTWQF